MPSKSSLSVEPGTQGLPKAILFRLQTWQPLGRQGGIARLSNTIPMTKTYLGLLRARGDLNQIGGGRNKVEFNTGSSVKYALEVRWCRWGPGLGPRI